MNQRDQILFGEDFNEAAYSGGVRYFKNISAKTLGSLVDLGFTKEDDRHNFAPSIAECLEYADELSHCRIAFSGYAVSPRRQDARISIDTVIIEPQDELFTIEDACEIASLFRSADEFNLSPELFTGWWD